jgi:hypothetical protein
MSFWPKCEVCGKRYVRSKSSPLNYGEGVIELEHKCKVLKKKKPQGGREDE